MPGMHTCVRTGVPLPGPSKRARPAAPWRFLQAPLPPDADAHMHACMHPAQEMRQCLIYDSGAADARLIGVEYIISRRLYEVRVHVCVRVCVCLCVWGGAGCGAQQVCD